MKKKISILTLTIIFFASSTGLPLVLHYCEMMDSVSFEVCEMHNPKAEKTSCCEETNNAKIFFSNVKDPCCSDKLVDTSVKDNFVNVKTELSQKLNSSVVFNINPDNYSFNSFNKFFTDISPPPLLGNHLYLTNSILLI